MIKFTKEEIKERKRLGYYPLSATEQITYIILYSIKSSLRSLLARIKHNYKMRRSCKHICLWCEYFDDCVSSVDTVAVEHKGYTVSQSGTNYHTTIIDCNGKMVYHAQTQKLLSENELREIVDWYIDFTSKEDIEL